MSANDLLTDLRARGVRVELAGPDLTVEGPEGALTEDVVAKLREHKAELVTQLRRQVDRPTAPSSRGHAGSARTALDAQADHLDAVLARASVRPRLRFPGHGEVWLLRDTDPDPGDGTPTITISEWLALWADGKPHPGLLTDVLALKAVFGAKLEKVLPAREDDHG